jgi:hypothetical protein
MANDEVHRISALFNRPRKLNTSLDINNVHGIYAIFVKNMDAINEFPANTDGLIYIGSSSDLVAREYEQHFRSGKTGFSTLRRSLGAIKKLDLNLVALPRGPELTERNFHNYKFQLDGENRLTTWMLNELEVLLCPTCQDYKLIESSLIILHKPILNLKGWANPYRKHIKALRKNCSDEARSNRQTTQ